MWRAIFLACGISLCILGAECMIVHKAVLAAAPKAEGVFQSPKPREIQPPEWGAVESAVRRCRDSAVFHYDPAKNVVQQLMPRRVSIFGLRGR